MLNIDDSAETLDSIHGTEDRWWYLRAPEFCRDVVEPMARIVEPLRGQCLDVGCGDAMLSDHTTVSYVGIDGSAAALERAAERMRKTRGGFGLIEALVLTRFENPCVYGTFPTCVFSGILEVLVKPEGRVPLMEMYRQRFGVRDFILCDLERLDTSAIEEQYSLVEEMHVEAKGLAVEEVKRKRKILHLEVR